MLWSRRSVLGFLSAAVPMQMFSSSVTIGATQAAPAAAAVPLADNFPGHPTEMVREVVLVSHFNEKRVRELVDARPALARAAWDWGFGDWETALGAASHMGNRGIAEYLLSKGARPSLFSAAMLGQLDVVKAFISAMPGAQKIRGPHGIPLLAHAKFGGAAAKPVFDYLQTLEGAGEEPETPMTDADKKIVLGNYVFGSGATQQVDVTLEQQRGMSNAQLTWTRKGTIGRPLHHLGNREFYPAGAPAVRIRFVQNDDEVVMTVHDPDLVMTAKRKA